ncbi:MAG: Uma2 family endonuclease [Firmicutes bacterium]|nr:Uma2 family endonuclease [Bacillota bacterium]
MPILAEQLEREKYYTYEDWLNFDDGVHAEIVDGRIYMMAEPSQRHQEILMELGTQFHTFLRGKPCRVFPAPFGVKLFKNRHTILEPDLSVVCDRSKLNGKICDGAPDLVVEILSPSTSGYDKIIKLNQYLQAGVKEYWIIGPEDSTVTVCTLENGKYVVGGYIYPNETGETVVPVKVLPGLEIDLRQVFEPEQGETI